MTEERYIFPKDLNEASELLENEGAVLVAGGTSLVFRRPGNDRTFVDISRIAPKVIKIVPETITLGSMVRIRDILCDPDLDKLNCGILRQTASNIATTPVRNQITVGGSIAMIYPWSDLPVSFLVLDAKVVTHHHNGGRTLTAEEFFSGQPARKLRPGEIVTEVKIPIHLRDHLFSFTTLGRTKGDFAAIDLAVGYRDTGEFERLRIAVSAVTPLPVRLIGLEEELEGMRKDSGEIDELLEKHISGIKPRNFRYGGDYLRRTLKVLLKRSLAQTGNGRQ